MPRTYLAKVKGTPDEATLDKLRGGVRLEDGMATPVSVDVLEKAERNTWLQLVVAEGRPHLIKRLCAAVGSPVVRLYRPSYAGVTVEGLRPGEKRPLTQAEVRLLQDVSDGKVSPDERALKLPPRRHGRTAPGFEADVDADDEDFSEEAPPAPAQAARTERPERGASKAERPARAAGRPERKELGPRGDGGARPAFRSATGGRAERRTWTPREDAQEETREARPERREWAPRGGGEERGARGGRPARGSFGTAERGAERRGPPRGERPERREWAPRGGGEERGARGERKPAFAGGSAERRVPSRGPRPERREWAPRGEERGESKPAFAGGSAERRVPARSPRPERREWAPREERGERGARPERREWAPRGCGGCSSRAQAVLRWGRRRAARSASG